jgi:hypothetical protein
MNVAGILKFVKAHAISLLCGVAALLFVGIGLMGMGSTAVVDALTERVQESGGSNISSLRNNPQNERTIEAEKKRGEQFQEEFAKAMEVLKSINRREPLMEGIFPKPQSLTKPEEFRETYVAQVTRLPLKLEAGTLPTEADRYEARQNIQDELQREAEMKAEGGAGAAAISPETLAQPQAPLTPSGQPSMEEMLRRMRPAGGGGRFGEEAGGSPLGEAPMMAPGAFNVPQGDPKYDENVRARVAKAKSIRCYYALDSFHTSPIYSPEVKATPEEMWKAQVSLWVQQDIVDALEELNRASVAKIKDGDPCVEQMPVKRIVRVRIWGYEGASVFVPFTTLTDQQAAQPASLKSFTGRKSDDLVDVLKFSVTLVVDQRYVNEVVDAISRRNYYKCYNAELALPPETDATEGYMYGTAPVVRVTFDFEGYMAKAIYGEIMPPEVANAISGAGAAPAEP